MKIACIGDQHGNIRNFIRVVNFNSWDDIPNDVAMAITFN